MAISVEWAWSPIDSLNNSGGSGYAQIFYDQKPNSITTILDSSPFVRMQEWIIGDTYALAYYEVDPVGGIINTVVGITAILEYEDESYSISAPIIIDGSNYVITPETASLPVAGGTVVFNVKSDYPLSYYSRVSGGTLNYISDNEVEVVCTLPANDGASRTHYAFLESDTYGGIESIALPGIVQEGIYLEEVYPTTVSSEAGTFEIRISSNTDWTVSNTSNCTVDVTSGTGDGVITVSYDEWFTYGSDRILSVKLSSNVGTHIILVTQTNTIPWIVIDNQIKTLPYTGGAISFDNYYANTNCETVELSTTVGTLSTNVHNGTWGETTSMNFTLEVPETEEARTIIVTGTSETSDGIPITGEFRITQDAPYTFNIDTDTLRNVKQDGGIYTMEYTTSAPSIELTLTSVPDFITDFTYTQPVDGVGTFSLNYESNFLSNSRYSHPYIEAAYNGYQIGRIRVNDYQWGTSFWLPDTSDTISYKAQIFSTIVHNNSLDVKQSNIYVYPVVEGLTLNSYTPSTEDSSGILYLNIPANTGADRTFRIKVDVLDDAGKVLQTETGITITQLEMPKIIDVQLNVDAAYHKEAITLELDGDWWVDSKTNWLSADPKDGTGSNITILIDVNPTGNTRVGYLYVYGEAQTYRVKVTQTSLDYSFDPDGESIPICDEITFTQNADKVEYHIYNENDGELIYSAFAYKYPDEDSMEISLNDLLSDYLSNKITFKTEVGEMDGFLREFSIRTYPNSGYKLYSVYDSWERPYKAFLNDPISNVVDPRQYIFANYLDGYAALTLYENGDEVASANTISGMKYVSKDRLQPCGTTLNYDLKNDSEVIDVLQFVYGTGTKDYVLYYVNAYGGWDSLLVDGNVLKSDAITSYTYRNKQRGKVKYLNTINPKWQLYTGNMNDGSKMYHLLESNEVYLHNLKTDEIIPVVITDSTCEYKTYANQGNTRFHYTINVEASNYKIRK